jgi:hypothetical protein
LENLLGKSRKILENGAQKLLGQLFGTKNCQLLSRSDGKVKAEFKEMDASRAPSSGKMIQLMDSELMVGLSS